MRPKPGDAVTAVYQGRVNRHVLLLKVVKVGRKYLHGLTQFVEPDGQIRDGHEVKVNLEESTIYPGLRHDLRASELKYRDDYRQWQLQKRKHQEDIMWEFRNFVRERLDEWEADHPMPQPSEFPDL